MPPRLADPRRSRPFEGRHRAARGRPARTRGFSLLEVLVAIVVLSFGVLGMVGLQAASLQANKEARFQSSAVRLARELSDLMRGNYVAAAAAGNAYLNAAASATTLAGGAAAENCYTQTCSSPATIAAFQKVEWARRLADELPDARAEVCFDTAPYAGGRGKWGCTAGGDVVYIKLGWTRQSTNRTDTALEQATSVPLIVMPVIPQ